MAELDIPKDLDRELESRLRWLPAEKKGKILEILQKDKQDTENNDEGKLDSEIDIKEDDSRETKVDKVINIMWRNDESFWKIYDILKNNDKFSPHKLWLDFGSKTLSLDTAKKLIKNINEKKCSKERLVFILYNSKCFENVDDNEIIDFFVENAEDWKIRISSLVQNLTSVEKQKYLFDELLKIWDWRSALGSCIWAGWIKGRKWIDLWEWIDPYYYLFENIVTKWDTKTILDVWKFFIEWKYKTPQHVHKLIETLKKYWKTNELEILNKYKEELEK